MGPTQAQQAERGRVTWHSSEEDAGPDVGLALGLGDGTILWCGEISRDRWLEIGGDDAGLGNDCGWWIIIYSGAETIVVGKVVDAIAANALIDHLQLALDAGQPDISKPDAA